jgi:hypothetical protein
MLAERNLSALRYPRSFLGLLVAAFLLVALPLIGTLLIRLAPGASRQSRSAVSPAAERGPRAGEPHRFDRTPGTAAPVLPDANCARRAPPSFPALGAARAADAKDEPRGVHPLDRAGSALRLCQRPPRADLRTVRGMAAALVKTLPVLAVVLRADREWSMGAAPTRCTA